LGWPRLQVRKMEQEQHADALVQIICAYPVFIFFKKNANKFTPAFHFDLRFWAKDRREGAF
jgi:hypothetical protein